MARLRRADCSGPGIQRVKRGKGFSYQDAEGNRVDEPEVLARINELVIPPAWKDVWICPYPMGHIQATGVDAAGRKQYLYHQRWREQRDRQKFDDMIAFANDLPLLRKSVQETLEGSDKLDRDRVLAAAVRLLDRGFFRIGSEDYAVTNESYGLATMRKEHVTLDGDDTMTFDYPAKSGVRQVRDVVDPLTFEVVAQLKRRRSGGDELLAYKVGRTWRDIRSPDINAFIKERTGGEHSAKDFRTWNATLLAAVALGVSQGATQSKTARKRAITRAVKEVAFYLGNTPTVCRASYIDPRVIDAFQGGVGISPELIVAEDDDLPIHHQKLEKAVLDLLAGHESAPGIEQLAA